MDLFIGAISEKPVPGAVLGPTFQCIVGDQFRRLRLGDRFWYEEPNQQGSFNLGMYTKMLTLEYINNGLFIQSSTECNQGNKLGKSLV